MKEYPILFQPDMVQAKLEGRKSQTRRLTGMKVINYNPDQWTYASSYVDEHCELINVFKNLLNGLYVHLRCPYGDMGSILWVRETWKNIAPFHFINDEKMYVFKASDEKQYPASSWKPSIHMPKDAARIYLQNTGIRVQRLQEISEEDAEKEGVLIGDEGFECWDYIKKEWGHFGFSPVESFKTLIQKINGPEVWDQNPWVRAISFRILSTTGRPANLEELCAAR